MDDQIEDHPDQENFLEGIVLSNYRPITCLPIMWKIQTAQIREEIFYSVINSGLFPWKSQNRKNVYLSPYVEEPLN